jgi:hypothetical protein
MARNEHLPIYKQALDVAVHFEKVVAALPGHPSLLLSYTENVFYI